MGTEHGQEVDSLIKHVARAVKMTYYAIAWGWDMIVAFTSYSFCITRALFSYDHPKAIKQAEQVGAGKGIKVWDAIRKFWEHPDQIDRSVMWNVHSRCQY